MVDGTMKNGLKLIGQLISIGVSNDDHEAIEPSIGAVILLSNCEFDDDDNLIRDEQILTVNIDAESASFLAKYLFKKISVIISPIRPELVKVEGEDTHSAS